MNKIDERFDNEIEKIVKETILYRTSNLSHFLKNQLNELRIECDAERIRFIHIDNSKPYHYKEFVNGEILNRTFTDKVKSRVFDYPYKTVHHPAEIVEKTSGAFGTGDYKIYKEYDEKVPNEREIKNIILNALEEFSDI